MPEDAIGTGGVVFSVGFEDGFAVRSCQLIKLVGAQTGMTGVDLKFSQCSADSSPFSQAGPRADGTFGAVWRKN